MESWIESGWIKVGDKGIFKDIVFVEGYDNSCNVYLINSKDITLIDTGNDFTIFFELQDRRSIYDIENIFLTHSHNDHTLGLFELLRRYEDLSFTVYLHESSSDGLKRILNRVGRENIRILELKGNETINMSGYEFRVLYTPGHTIDSISLYNEEFGVIFSGDSVVMNPVIDERLGGKLTDYITSLKFLRQLEVNAILPGHGYIAKKDCKSILDAAYLKAIGELSEKSLKDAALTALKLGMIDEAEFALENLREDLLDEEAIKALASIKADKGDYGRVIELLSPLIDRNDFQSLYIAGMAALKVMRYDDAIKFFKRILSIREDRRTKIMLGTALYESGRIEDAMQIEEFKKIVQTIKRKDETAKNQK